jgi:hypothetical protein
MTIRRRRFSLIWVVAVSSLCTFAKISEVRAAEKLGLPQQKKVLLNRAVLTAARQVYTATDAVAMIAVWNLTRTSTEKMIPLETDWLKELPTGSVVPADPTAVMKNWPEDLRQFFQMALIWVDVQKLNLFVLREQEITEVQKKFKNLTSDAFGQAPEVLVKGIMTATDVRQKKWVESVLRVRSFIRVRGTLERNKNLFSVGWYWHKFPPPLPGPVITPAD